MAKIFVHALAATAGGGLTYLKNVVPRLASIGAGHEWHVLVNQAVVGKLTSVPDSVKILTGPQTTAGALGRIVYDQWSLRRRLVREQFDVIVATGNFGLLRPPIPQILLSRNPLYFSERHCLELRRRRLWREYASIIVKRHLALWSIRSSVFNVPPTAAFQHHIARFGRINPLSFRPIHHGFDEEHFHAGSATLNNQYAELLGRRTGVRRVLFVSHYNYFRNFETVLRALAVLKQTCAQPIQLVLTTTLGKGLHEHRYDTSEAAELIHALGIAHEVAMLGHVPYEQLAPLYKACDVAVCPSYAETFGHPMVEAMSCGLPVIATNMDIHREICADAAVYFSVSDPDDLAAKLNEVLGDSDLRERLAQAGLVRSKAFSWDRHVKELASLIAEAAEGQSVSYSTWRTCR